MTISKKTNEFIIHGKDKEYDYHYVANNRLTILETINEAHKALHENNSKLHFSILDLNSLKNFVTKKTEKDTDADFCRMDKDNLNDLDEYIAEEKEDKEIINEIENINLAKSAANLPPKLDDFKLLKVLGRGSFGKVFMVQYKKNGKIYAMKCLKKEQLLIDNQIKNTLLEKEILQNINHPFLCQLVFCFQNEDHVYFVMPFIGGGELFTHLRRAKRFSEAETKFYAYQIGQALQYMHSNGIIYRDLKPENILIDANGYIKITDFGISKKLSNENEKAKTLCGTPEYLAPEILLANKYDKSVDWWSFGILVYEMLNGHPPFCCGSMQTLFEMIRLNPVRFNDKLNLSKEAKDFVVKLLIKNPKDRLGSKDGMKEIVEHDFFKGYDFKSVDDLSMKPPYIPKIRGDDDVSNFDGEYTGSEVKQTVVAENNRKLIQKNQHKFKDFNS